MTSAKELLRDGYVNRYNYHYLDNMTDDRAKLILNALELGYYFSPEQYQYINDEDDIVKIKQIYEHNLDKILPSLIKLSKKDIDKCIKFKKQIKIDPWRQSALLKCIELNKEEYDTIIKASKNGVTYSDLEYLIDNIKKLTQSETNKYIEGIQHDIQREFLKHTIIKLSDEKFRRCIVAKKHNFYVTNNYDIKRWINLTEKEFNRLIELLKLGIEHDYVITCGKITDKDFERIKDAKQTGFSDSYALQLYKKPYTESHKYEIIKKAKLYGFQAYYCLKFADENISEQDLEKFADILELLDLDPYDLPEKDEDYY